MYTASYTHMKEHTQRVCSSVDGRALGTKEVGVSWRYMRAHVGLHDAAPTMQQSAHELIDSASTHRLIHGASTHRLIDA